MTPPATSVAGGVTTNDSARLTQDQEHRIRGATTPCGHRTLLGRCPQGVVAPRGALAEPRVALDGRAVDIDHSVRRSWRSHVLCPPDALAASGDQRVRGPAQRRNPGPIDLPEFRRLWWVVGGIRDHLKVIA
ncbi:hypothetical protein B7767_26055 [Streptomyces sp. 13-12-16]|nr:hypothetical protein B7767_26055 [Streptomyces sp. 13-12-16]